MSLPRIETKEIIQKRTQTSTHRRPSGGSCGGSYKRPALEPCVVQESTAVCWGSLEDWTRVTSFVVLSSVVTCCLCQSERMLQDSWPSHPRGCQWHGPMRLQRQRAVGLWITCLSTQTRIRVSPMRSSNATKPEATCSFHHLSAASSQFIFGTSPPQEF